MAPPPPELLEELVEEILLRLPSDDPASLARAALVSKRWRRLISGGGFIRRLSEFHRSSPPLLGFLCNQFHAGSLFVPTPSSSFRPSNANRHGLRAIHACHGRVLLHHAQWGREGLFVWDPIADKQRELPMGPQLFPTGWNAAVLCGEAGCDHLGCHRGPFLVVFVGHGHDDNAFSLVYSSEANAWSKPIYVEGQHEYAFEMGNSVLLGSTLYFKASNYGRVLKYDLLTQKMSPAVRLPAEVQGTQMRQRNNTVLIATEDGRLGFAFAAVHESNRGYALYLSSREHGPDDDDEGARWAQDKVIMLDGLKIDAGSEVQVAGFAGNRAGGVVFIWTCAGFFTVDLKSWKSKKVGESIGFSPIVVPYVSFCIPVPEQSKTRSSLYR
ncbi:unnamed protein product [Urochloa decumbens]|uniref:F-box domain-containing protein n=1 Tax=Urochloa decumbens TaxID=240449 RepID=A0ABC9FMZ0_9POAL